MGARGYLALVVVGGCFQPHPPANAPCSPEGTCPDGLRCSSDGFCVTTASDSDAAPGLDGPCTTFARQFDTCAHASGADILISGARTYNTDTHTLDGMPVANHAIVQGLAGPIDVVFVSTFSIDTGATLQVVGATPFGIAATGPITIGGTIVISAGGRAAAMCGAAAGRDGVSQQTGSSGGGGGAFQGGGGASGIADTNGTQIPGSAGGTPGTKPAGPLGGCPGGKGGGLQAGTVAGGVGGGALYLVSAIGVAITGALNAGGGGGIGGTSPEGGGGGGGAGGMLLLEAPIVSVGGTLAANGGGGGGGTNVGTTMPGQPGGANATPSPGGLNGGNGTAGAPGAAGAMLKGGSVTVSTISSSGGGGGGAGFIAIDAPQKVVTGATISPALTPWP